MTQTETTSLASMALALASAKKPCPCIGMTSENKGHYWCPSCAMNHYCYANYDPNSTEYYHTTNCEDCKGTGEVYVLPKETRVECDGVISMPGERIWRTSCPARFPEKFTSFTSDELKRVRAQDRCEGRGWLVLDPMLLGRWQVALAEAGRVISVWPPGALVDDETDTHNEGWMSA